MNLIKRLVEKSQGQRSTYRLVFTLLVAAWVGLFVKVPEAGAAGRTFPFRPGERLTFEARWGFIPAGVAVLQVLPLETVNGVRSYHFVMEAKTYPLVDVFFKVRDRIDAYADEKMRRSILYRKRKRGKKKKDVVVRFDWGKRQVHYANFGRPKDPITIPKGTFDPLSVFYAFRLSDLYEGVALKAPVTDGRTCIMGRARVIKREKITVASGTYDTYLVEPELEHIGGVFEKSRDAKLQIWVTADSRRLPVKVKSKVIVGSFYGELISATGLIGGDLRESAEGPKGGTP
jgi:hypothetical protein